MRISTLSLSLIAILAVEGSIFASAASAKAWTVEQRQAKLMQDVNEGQKSGALSAHESKVLRKKLSNVARKKAKMKEKQRGKLTADDTANLQSRIDKASVTIKREKKP